MFFFFSGASPVRRDHGRGLTAAQWARYCSRNLCADAIEKFIRTAVPGGEEIVSDACRDITKEKDKSGRFHFRSSSSSRNSGKGSSSSWLVRKLKKALPGAKSGEVSGSGGGSGKFSVPQVQVTEEEEEGDCRPEIPDLGLQSPEDEQVPSSGSGKKKKDKRK